MTKPVRLQLSRKRGFNLQEHSLSVNGLPAVNCARPSLYSNPFKIGGPSGFMFNDGGDPTPMIASMSREQSVDMFRTLITGITTPEMHPWGHNWRRHLEAKIGGAYPFGHLRNQLRGKNLACFCNLDEACHCDVWLNVANQ